MERGHQCAWVNCEWGRAVPTALWMQKPWTDVYCLSWVVSRHTCEAPHRVSGITRAGLTTCLVQLAEYLPMAMACTHTAERKEDLVPASGQ